MQEQPLLNFSSPTFAQQLIGMGVALTLLFTAISPASTESLTVYSRALYWCLHIGVGLAAAAFVAHLLLGHFSSMRDWRLILFSGLGGLLLFAPIAYGLESLFPIVVDGADTEWSDQFARTSTLAAIVVEAYELAPAYLASWLFINYVPQVASLSDAQHTSAQSLGAVRLGSSNIVEDTSSVGPEAEVAKVSLPHTERSNLLDASLESFLDRLPPIIGRELVAMSSDLHYLHVITREGKAMVLGALQEVEDIFGDTGLRVHRSHWVSLGAVIKLHKVASGWQLELVGGHRVPVSRRKKSVVLERLGEDFLRLPHSS